MNRLAVPEFCVSIALAEQGVPVVGVILNPVAGVTIHASRGGGCYRNDAPVRVSNVARLEDAVMIASRTEISRDKFKAHAGWFKELRPVGSIAWKLACVAAGDCLVTEAGGLYVAFDGSRRVYNQADTLIETFMAAGPPALVKAFCEREQARLRGAA